MLYGELVFITFIFSALPTPKEVQVQDITASAAKVKWNMLDDETNLENVDHYNVHWNSSRGGGRSDVKGTSFI